MSGEIMKNVSKGLRAVRQLGALALASVLWIGVAQAAMPARTVSVSISSPTANAVFAARTNVTIQATVTPETPGTVAKVDFYRGTSLIGSDTTSPYSVTWSNVPAGSYSLTAKVTFSKGTAMTSAAVPIIVNAPPTVSLSSPTASAVFGASASIPIVATAADSDGTIAKVAFYQGTTLIGSDTTAPYGITWSAATAGTYSLTAQATDNQGAVTTSGAISIVVKAPPTVSLTSPAANTVFAPQGTITITAAAASSSSTISKVDFYQGSTLIASDTTAPYSVSWSNVAAGNYTLTAKATDATGGITTSAGIPIVVNTPPTVSLTSPAANALFGAPASVTLTATAADSNGTIAKVDFYQGTTLIGTASAAPYSILWNNAPAGSYSLTAKATDNQGGVTSSSAVPISIKTPPSVALTAPASNATFAAPASITLSATASSSGGSITQVAFYQGSSLIGTKTSAPYGLTWSAVPAGSYTLTAKATDSNGLSSVSSPLSVTVGAGSTAVYYLHNDHLNTPRLVMDEQNTVVWRNRPLQEPFGVAPPEEDPDGNGTPFVLNLRFPGQYFDKETNLSYNYYRDYDPTTGRYVQSDPIGLQGGINTYGYVKNQPIRYIDPTGQCFGPLAYLCYLGVVYAEELTLAAIVGAEIASGVPNPVSTPASGAMNTARAVEQYSLIVAESGFYPIMTRGAKEATSLKWCERGDVWKYGTTKNRKNRYSQSYLDSIGEYGVEYSKEFSGSLAEALKLENMKINNFLQQTGTLPAGNKIIR